MKDSSWHIVLPKNKNAKLLKYVTLHFIFYVNNLIYLYKAL